MFLIEKLSNMILSKLKQDNAIDGEIEEAYKYGLQILIINFLGVIVSITIGLLFSALLETLIFLLSFVFTRRYCGGYHTNTLWKCLLTTAGMITAVLMFDKYFTLSMPICVLIFIISNIIFFVFAPIENANKPLSSDLKKRNKKISLIILIFQCLIGFILLLLDIKFYSIIFITIALISFFVVISVLKERGGKSEKSIKNRCKSISKSGSKCSEQVF